MLYSVALTDTTKAGGLLMRQRPLGASVLPRDIDIDHNPPGAKCHNKCQNKNTTPNMKAVIPCATPDLFVMYL